jgi:5-methylcytosine-specific restriction enzyme A
MNLAMHPMCAECERQGRTKEANVTHHVFEYRESFSELDFWRGPFASLCFDCHFTLHHGGVPRDFDTSIDASGWPRDPLHPVFQTNVAKRERK